MASGMDWLSALLLGGGTFAKQVGDAGEFTRQERLKQEQLRIDKQRADQLMTLQERQLAQNQAQFDATRGDKFTSPEEVSAFMRYIGMKPPAEMEQQLGPAGRISKEYVPAILAQASKLQENQRQREQELATGAFLQSAKGIPAQLTGALAEGEDPEAAAMIPRTAGRPAMSQWDVGAGLASLGHKDAGIKALMETLYPQNRFTSLSQDAPGTLNTVTGEATLFGQGPGGRSAEAPPEMPGVRNLQAKDAKGNPTWRQESISVGTEREGAAIERGYRSFAEAPEPVRQEINREIATRSLQASERQGVEAARLQAKPLNEDDAKGVRTAGMALGTVAQIKGFSDQEINKYVGYLNVPVAQLQQVAAGLGLGTPDQRFIEFHAANGRMRSAMFDQAGKALTPMEKEVQSAYIPTGNEANGAAYKQKVKNYEVVTRVGRDIQLEMSKTGRGNIDTAEYDRRLLAGLEKAGIKVQPHPDWSDGGQRGGGWGKAERVR